MLRALKMAVMKEKREFSIAYFVSYRSSCTILFYDILSLRCQRRCESRT